MSNKFAVGLLVLMLVLALAPSAFSTDVPALRAVPTQAQAEMPSFAIAETIPAKNSIASLIATINKQPTQVKTEETRTRQTPTVQPKIPLIQNSKGKLQKLFSLPSRFSFGNKK
ncbi:MAG: hypothetical protein A2751_02685 [Candidatus Doudnabacteria bacterium RIFCSPHIGHO2_01_FULL_46_14]|uniref:Uncharacterized protein n=1 Tax=Candidatus Doudnabacteria bacterium RIFCSPHIGHO2_01_FULL_46_14 TaxID=1817824 RepID=A0A1F5NJQ6_9BACT|nr:MAG: hypothetical protein A2751_02685 [Candidatus Doudnabacteria bacterium RIFCSPHIGHO2_01_FULL_46_14]